MRFMVTLHQNLYSIVQITINRIWGSRVENTAQMEKFSLNERMVRFENEAKDAAR